MAADTPADEEIPAFMPDDDANDVAKLYKEALKELEKEEEDGLEVGAGRVRVNPRKRGADEMEKDEAPAAADSGSVNPNVWVTGLPPDATPSEVEEYFKKCGVVRVDPQTGFPKIKLYTNDKGERDGTALVTYYRVESVPMAIEYLDKSYFRENCQITVEEAKFESKGEDGQPRKKPRQNKKKKKKIFDQTRDLAWDEGAARGSHLPRTVIVKNFFETKDFADPNFLEDLKADLEPEFAKFGELQRFIIFDTHPDGVVSAKYREHEDAKKCFESMLGRFFGGRALSVEWWDGVTKYKVPESDELRELRLAAFGDFLEGKTKEGGDAGGDGGTGGDS